MTCCLLALWLPLFAVAAAWLWQRKPRGYLLGGASVVMGAIESVSIAADQWYGHAADPASTVVSAVLTPIFVALAVLSLAVPGCCCEAWQRPGRRLPRPPGRTGTGLHG
jgi:hypothetical protein